jgi:ABC-2 type transport system ATP-binding protein
MKEILWVKNLSKNYDGVKALDGISFCVYANEIVGLLGPNGAGKTTTINIILGILKQDNGEIIVNGMDLKHHRSKILKSINFFVGSSLLPGNLTVYENLYIFSLLYGLKNKTVIEDLLNRFSLQKFRNIKAGLLSAGEQTRLGLAKSMLNSPVLLLLDEPTASLDPSIAKDIRKLIRNFAKERGCGVLWTSHNMHEVEEICDRVIFLSEGKILIEGNPKSLPKEYGKNNLEELFIFLAKQPLNSGG